MAGIKQGLAYLLKGKDYNSMLDQAESKVGKSVGLSKPIVKVDTSTVDKTVSKPKSRVDLGKPSTKSGETFEEYKARQRQSNG